jgi:glutathione S-transferase
MIMQSINPIRIHHIEGRRSFRVIWLCEEAGIPYELIYKRGDIRASLMAIRKAFPDCPMAPVAEIGGNFIVETGAILDVLANRYAKQLIPAVESADYALHAQWSHFAESSFGARTQMDMFMAMVKGARIEDMPKGYISGVDRLDAPKLFGTDQMLRFIESHLGKHLFFGGSSFSTADIMMQWPLRVSRMTTGAKIDQFPNLIRWHDRVEARPAYRRAVDAAIPDGMSEFMIPKTEKFPFPPLMPGLKGVIARVVTSAYFSFLIHAAMWRRWFRSIRA